jgi:hypothetical protein
MRHGPSERSLPGHVFVTPGGGDANPSLENTALGPPRAPGRHLSIPDRHPTPGQYTWLPGQPITAPARPGIISITTATTAAAAHTHMGTLIRFICLWSRLLLLLGVAASANSLAPASRPLLTQSCGDRFDIEKPGRLVLTHLLYRRTLSGAGVALGWGGRRRSGLPGIHGQDDQRKQNDPGDHLFVLCGLFCLGALNAHCHLSCGGLGRGLKFGAWCLDGDGPIALRAGLHYSQTAGTARFHFVVCDKMDW